MLTAEVLKRLLRPVQVLHHALHVLLELVNDLLSNVVNLGLHGLLLLILLLLILVACAILHLFQRQLQGSGSKSARSCMD